MEGEWPVGRKVNGVCFLLCQDYIAVEFGFVILDWCIFALDVERGTTHCLDTSSLCSRLEERRDIRFDLRN